MGVKRKCIHSAAEKSPLLFSHMRELCRRAEVSRARLRQAVRGSDLAPGGAGLGRMLERAMCQFVLHSLASEGRRR